MSLVWRMEDSMGMGGCVCVVAVDYCWEEENYGKCWETG